MVWQALIIKELTDFENPANGVLSVEPGDVELHMRFVSVWGMCGGVRRWWVWRGWLDGEGR